MVGVNLKNLFTVLFIILWCLVPCLGGDNPSGEAVLYRGVPEFSGGNQGNGGRVERGALGNVEQASIFIETSGGTHGNAATGFRSSTISADSPLIVRINQVLQQPAGQSPVFFSISFDVVSLNCSDKFIRADFTASFAGNSAPQRDVVSVRSNFYSVLKKLPVGGAYRFTPDNTPELLFAVWPCSGKKKIEGFNFSVGLRVDSRGTDARIALSNIAIAEVPLQPAVKSAASVGVSPENPESPVRIAFVGGLSHRPSAELLESVAKTGLFLQPYRNNLDVSAEIYVLCGGSVKDVPAADIKKILERGGVIFCDFNNYDWEFISDDLSVFLPINSWSVKRRNIRGSSRILVEPGSGFPAGNGDGLEVDWRYDLHLPGAPVESGMHRYQPGIFGKVPQNNRWQVLLRSSLEGKLPLLVKGKYGRGTVYVFGSDISSPRLIASAEYSALCSALLGDMVKSVRQNRLAADKNVPRNADGLQVQIEPYQPDDISATIVNRGSKVRKLTIVSRINAYSGELIRKDVQEASVPAGGSRKITIGRKAAGKGVDSIGHVSEETPYRRLSLAILPSDSSAPIMEKETVICTAVPVNIAIREDTASYDTLKKWPDSAEWPDGRIGMRYVYNCGEKPAVEILLRNGMVNIAPLAKASDLQWGQNPTIGGINDLSRSNSSLRGRLAMQGGWAGRQSDTQGLRLDWGFPVLLSGISLDGYGGYRNWYKNNPRNFILQGILGDKRTELLQVENTEFAARWGKNRNMQDAHRAYFDAVFPVQQVKACELNINGLDPEGDYENSHYRPANCSILEWEVWGWPQKSAPPALRGNVQIVLHSLMDGKSVTLMDEPVELPRLAQTVLRLDLPTFTSFTPARLDMRYVDANKKLQASRSMPLLFVPENGRKLLSKNNMYAASTGLLCSPGVVQANDFGKGMQNYIKGWGGPHDQLWMLLHGLMEWGSGTRYDLSRMLTTPGRICHYTNPWKAMPDGVVAFDMVAEQLLQSCLNGRFKREFTPDKPSSFHIVGSDRWNGIPVGSSFGWIEYENFDRYLREKIGHGLQAKGMAGIGREIISKYADVWQQWHMERYARRLLAIRKMYADKGIDFTFETHGSFPLCGGELGREIAVTHEGVGTDLFWELHNQDVIYSIGRRFGLTAVNPDLRNGMYNQWGWVNSDLNKFWFSNNSSVEPAVRQWYLTYFAGQVGNAGEFLPYHYMGFSRQGNYGTKMLPEDYREMFRVQNLTTQVRPESATGFGIIVSWDGQLKRCGPAASRLGFGIFPAEGEDSVEIRFGDIYHKLVKNGLPVSFVSSTTALGKWQGKQPLILVDGYNYLPEEMREVKRLNSSETPVIAIGSYADLGESHAGAEAFYGVRYVKGKYDALDGTKEYALPGGGRIFVKDSGKDSAPVLFCPVDGKELDLLDAQALVRRILHLVGNPLELPQGIAATSFISNGCLWLALGDQSDDDHEITLKIKPEWFMPELKGKKLRVIDMDQSRELAVQKSGDTLETSLPFPASAGRMLLFAPQ